MTFSISRRISIQWFPDDPEPSEPTNTIVLSAQRSGYFVDVRFMKSTGENGNHHTLDWAFAGVKKTDANGMTTFVHHIDSRTLDPLSVIDQGSNTSLPTHPEDEDTKKQAHTNTSEKGTMINPATGRMTDYEEIWSDEEAEKGIIIRKVDGSAWYARVGTVQIALGRTTEGNMWTWHAQAESRPAVVVSTAASAGSESESWKVLYSVGLPPNEIKFLPSTDDFASCSADAEDHSRSNCSGGAWEEGKIVIWEGDKWDILACA